MRDLKADLELCEKATAGPWFAYRTALGQVTVQCPPGWICVMSDKGNWATAKAIAEAREGWPEAIQRAMAAEERVKELEAAIEHFVETHLAWVETQPRRRKPCLQPNAAGESCFMREMESLRQEGYDTISAEQVEEWCPNCQHNWRMAQKRGGRANVRTGAIRSLVRAVKRWQEERGDGARCCDRSLTWTRP